MLAPFQEGHNNICTINILAVIPNLNYEAGSCDGEKLLIECPVGFSIQVRTY